MLLLFSNLQVRGKVTGQSDLGWLSDDESLPDSVWLMGTAQAKVWIFTFNVLERSACSVSVKIISQRDVDSSFS